MFDAKIVYTFFEKKFMVDTDTFQTNTLLKSAVLNIYYALI